MHRRLTQEIVESLAQLGLCAAEAFACLRSRLAEPVSHPRVNYPHQEITYLNLASIEGGASSGSAE
jgi:hypothetical protein